MAPQKKRKADDKDGLSTRSSVSPEHIASTETVDLHSFVNEAKMTEVEMILRVDVWSEDAVEVADALEDLCDLCYNGTTNEYNELHCKQAGETGAGSIIPAVMRKWSKSEEVLSQCCWALVRCVGKNEEDSLIAKHAKMSGAIDAVIWAMKTYPLNQAIQMRAIGALDGFASLHAKYIVKDVKILPAVVQSFTKFKALDSINNNTGSLLNGLSSFVELRDDMIVAGCLSVVGDIIGFYKQNGDIQGASGNIETAKETLVNLGSS